MKLRNKLILSCAALAAVATTAVSTTFAWYTANDTVKANGITGKTATQDATLLLISATGKQGNWGASVDINSSAITLDPVTYVLADKYVEVAGLTAGTSSVAGLYTRSGEGTEASPYTYTAVEGENAKAVANTTYYAKKEAGKYYQWDSVANAEGAEATGGTTAGQYISFYLYFKSGSNKSLNVQIAKFNLRNTTESLPTQTVLAEGTGSTTTSYSVDMLKATNIVMTVEQGTEALKSATANPALTAAGVRTAYACDSVGAAGTIGNAANAHTYYNNVKSSHIDDTIETSETTTSSNATATQKAYDSVATLIGSEAEKFTIGATGAGATGAQDSILMVKFDIYLDGWDKLCFDACRRQTFALDMEFTGVPVE